MRLNPREWWAHAGLADVYEMRGDFHKAEREYDIAARLEKQNVDVFVHRSNFYARRQDFERALTERQTKRCNWPRTIRLRFLRAPLRTIFSSGTIWRFVI